MSKSRGSLIRTRFHTESRSEGRFCHVKPHYRRVVGWGVPHLFSHLKGRIVMYHRLRSVGRAVWGLSPGLIVWLSHISVRWVSCPLRHFSQFVSITRFRFQIKILERRIAAQYNQTLTLDGKIYIKISFLLSDPWLVLRCHSRPWLGRARDDSI